MMSTTSTTQTSRPVQPVSVGPGKVLSNLRELTSQKRKLPESFAMPSDKKACNVPSDSSRNLSMKRAMSAVDTRALNNGSVQKNTMKRTMSVIDAKSVSPADFAIEQLQNNGVGMKRATSLPFLKPTEDMIAAYKIETIAAVREENLEKLRNMYQAGEQLMCCNRFGESLIHMACRRGCTEIVRFLVREAKVSLLLRDDYGRTPLHDACWTPKPNFDLVKLILEEVPEFLCLKDVRGHTPLNYIRKEHWNSWREFLEQNKELLRPKEDECARSA